MMGCLNAYKCKLRLLVFIVVVEVVLLLSVVFTGCHVSTTKICDHPQNCKTIQNQQISHTRTKVSTHIQQCHIPKPKFRHKSNQLLIPKPRFQTNSLISYANPFIANQILKLRPKSCNYSQNPNYSNQNLKSRPKS